MGVYVVDTAQSDGSQMVNCNMTTTVSYSLLTLSRRITGQNKGMVGIFIGAEGTVLVLGMEHH
jgi:hypothetical protein